MRVGFSTLNCTIAAALIFLQANLFAQSDTVYVRSNRKISITIGKDRSDLLQGVAAFPNARKERIITITEGDALTIDLPTGKSVLIDVASIPSRKLEISQGSKDGSISRAELNKFMSAQRKRSSNLAFEYLEKYKNGFFKEDALLLINAVNADDQFTQLSGAVQKGNMYLAGDLGLGLISNPGVSMLSAAPQKRKNDLLLAVSKFFDAAGELALQNSQYEKSIELYDKADRLAPDPMRAIKIQSAKQLSEDMRYTQLLKDADSLERIHALPETIRTLKKAMNVRNTQEISSRIARLDLVAQDSLYIHALKNDEKEDFIFYKKKGYYTYLSNYPNGKYVKPSEERITKLNKEILKVNKFTVFYGWGSASFQGATFMGKSSTSMNSVGIGRLTETRFLGLDFGFNQDFFAINKLEDYGQADLKGLDRVIVASDANGKNGYTSAFQGSVSFGVLSYKKSLLKVYAGGTVGWGQLTTWIHGYRYHIIKDKLPYDITGKTPHHYVVKSEELNADLANASFLLLVNYSNFLLKGSVSLNQPFVAYVSAGFAF